mgnify:CR=1 FL=1
MNCPYCNHPETKVSDSRDSKDGGTIKRRRECLRCEKRFSTIEKVLKLDHEVKKSNGAVEEFNIQKLKKSLLKACDKRPVTLEQIENLLNDTLNDLKQVEEGTINTTTIGKLVLRNLKEIDEISFLKYAIVHNNYETISEFIEEIDQLRSFTGLDYQPEVKEAMHQNNQR